MMSEDGRMNENAGPNTSRHGPSQYANVVVEELQQRGLIEKIEQYRHSVGHCYRCQTIIEPYLSDQVVRADEAAGGKGDPGDRRTGGSRSSPRGGRSITCTGWRTCANSAEVRPRQEVLGGAMQLLVSLCLDCNKGRTSM